MPLFQNRYSISLYLMARLKLFIPLIIFAASAVLFASILKKRETQAADFLPSALLGKPFPDFSLPQLEQGEAATIVLTNSDLPKQTFLLNVWGTWCPECYREHDTLLQIASSGIAIVGYNYKDDRDKALAYLRKLKDPFVLNLYDSEGGLGLDLGVYGAPETFVVSRDGIVLERIAGGIDMNIWEQRLAPFFTPNP